MTQLTTNSHSQQRNTKYHLAAIYHHVCAAIQNGHHTTLHQQEPAIFISMMGYVFFYIWLVYVLQILGTIQQRRHRLHDAGVSSSRHRWRVPRESSPPAPTPSAAPDHRRCRRSHRDRPRHRRLAPWPTGCEMPRPPRHSCPRFPAPAPPPSLPRTHPASHVGRPPTAAASEYRVIDSTVPCRNDGFSCFSKSTCPAKGTVSITMSHISPRTGVSLHLRHCPGLRLCRQSLPPRSLPVRRRASR